MKTYEQLQDGYRETRRELDEVQNELASLKAEHVRLSAMVEHLARDETLSNWTEAEAAEAHQLWRELNAQMGDVVPFPRLVLGLLRTMARERGVLHLTQVRVPYQFDPPREWGL